MKSKSNDRVSITLSVQQLKLIDRLAEEGILGRKRTDVVRSIIIQYLSNKFTNNP